MQYEYPILRNASWMVRGLIPPGARAWSKEMSDDRHREALLNELRKKVPEELARKFEGLTTEELDHLVVLYRKAEGEDRFMVQPGEFRPVPRQ